MTRYAEERKHGATMEEAIDAWLDSCEAAPLAVHVSIVSRFAFPRP